VKPIGLLVADVDGTLLTPDKVLTAEASASVERLRASGVRFAITSGRPPRGMAMLVGPLRLTTPVAAFNGGMFVKPDLTTVIEQRTVPRAVASEAVEVLLQAGLDAWVFRGADWYVRTRDAPHVARESTTLQFEPTVVGDLGQVLDGAVKIVGVSDDFPLVAQCEAELRQRVGSQASAARSQPYYLDVTHPEANKGMVVRQLSRVLGVPLEQIAAIGDMPTDVLMFAVAGLGIAMGNASVEVQRAARQVTSSNREEGFAHAVDTLVLGRPRTAAESLGLPPRTRACLFDLDGVLTRTAKLHVAAWKQMLDGYLAERARGSGAPFVPFDAVQDYTKYVDGKLRLDGARAFLASRGLEPPEDQLRALAARKDELFLELLARGRVETYEGSIRYLRAVHEAGLRTAVVSSSEHCKEVLASAGISELFDAHVDGVTAAREHLAGKPAPDTYLAAARAVGVAPDQAVIFEDALAGVEAGRAGHFGCVIGVDRAGQAAELRRHGADRVVTDLAALAEPPPGAAVGAGERA
jgi:beta-phosphoglucomutase family hydrolase/Cof subfamily protein (haloacid dehalogenase superfamily)